MKMISLALILIGFVVCFLENYFIKIRGDYGGENAWCAAGG